MGPYTQCGACRAGAIDGSGFCNNPKCPQSKILAEKESKEVAAIVTNRKDYEGKNGS